MRNQYSIKELSHALKVSRSGYYAASKRPESKRQQENSTLLHVMKSIHTHRHTRAYGSPRMTRELLGLGHACSENRVARLMRQERLFAKPRKPYRPKTTRPDHAAHPSPNLLAHAEHPTAPGTHLVSDITYIPTREGWLYLAIVLDLYSRSILGWKIADSMNAGLVTDALRRALASGLITANAIFHSDRGSQYSAKATRSLLALCGLRQSMSASGYCYDNAFAESAFASIKGELSEDGLLFDSHATAKSAVFDYIASFYNRKRRHGSLGYLSPDDFLKNHFHNLNPSLN